MTDFSKALFITRAKAFVNSIDTHTCLQLLYYGIILKRKNKLLNYCMRLR